MTLTKLLCVGFLAGGWCRTWIIHCGVNFNGSLLLTYLDIVDVSCCRFQELSWRAPGLTMGQWHGHVNWTSGLHWFEMKSFVVGSILHCWNCNKLAMVSLGLVLQCSCRVRSTPIIHTSDLTYAHVGHGLSTLSICLWRLMQVGSDSLL